MGSVYSTPVRFKLLDDQDEDIALSVSMKDKGKLEDEINKMVFSLSNDIKNPNDKNAESQKKSLVVDSVKANSLLKYFKVKKDEFSNNNKKWYEPTNAPKFTNSNAIYCYFQTENEKPSNLHFRVQYYADDWLFFKRVLFSIDGKAFEYRPLDTNTDSGNGGYILECFDDEILSSDKELIVALTYGKVKKCQKIDPN